MDQSKEDLQTQEEKTFQWNIVGSQVINNNELEWICEARDIQRNVSAQARNNDPTEAKEQAFVLLKNLLREGNTTNNNDKEKLRAFLAIVKDPEEAKQRYPQVTVIGPEALTEGYLITLRGSKHSVKQDPNILYIEGSTPLMLNTNLSSNPQKQVNEHSDTDEEEVSVEL